MPDIFVTKTPVEEKSVPVEVTSPAPSLAHPHAAATDAVTELLKERHHSIGPLVAYCVRPTGFSFVNQEPDEVVLLFLRRHFITNVPWLVSLILLALVPPLIMFISLLPGFFLFSIPTQLSAILTSFYYLILLGYGFGKFVSWFYNIGVVTQKRIVDLDSSNILAHNSAASNFNEIVDVKFTQNGFFQSFFNYGDIHIQTEAIHANFEFLAAPMPTKVTDIISDLRVATKGDE